MVKYYDSIPDHVIDWIDKQHMFTVATAPLSGDGHVNVSAKGLKGTFHVVNGNQVWYEDLIGSGCETISHIRENGRVTIYFNAFEGPPRICRLWGRGTVYEFGTPEYEAYIPPGTRAPGSRSVIFVDVHKVGTSCGYGVPFYEFKGHRDTLLDWSNKREKHDLEASGKGYRAENGLKAYWEEMNTRSIDGLPGLQSAHLSELPPEAERDMERYGVVNWKGPGKEKGKEGKGGDEGVGDRVGMRVREREVGREEMKLMILAFLFGAIVSAVFLRIAGPC